MAKSGILAKSKSDVATMPRTSGSVCVGRLDVIVIVTCCVLEEKSEIKVYCFARLSIQIDKKREGPRWPVGGLVT